jgi:predicted LPLAT superfamily acyltransferase
VSGAPHQAVPSVSVQGSGWSGQGTGTSLGNRFFMVVLRFCGVLPAYALLFFACVSYAVADRRTAAALNGLRGRLGLRTNLLARYRHIYCFGMNLIDRFSFLLRSRSPFAFTCINEEYISAALAAGRGCILLGAHAGNWEIAGNLLASRLAAPVSVVLLDAEREALQRVYAPALAQRRVKLIAVSPGTPDASVEIMARLRAGEIVAMLGDRHLGENCERIPFLGVPARFPRGPFVLAALSGAPLIPVFALKSGLRSYTFVAHDPISIVDVKRSERDAAIRAAMERYVRILEDVVRSHPYQWYNLYDFWS